MLGERAQRHVLGVPAATPIDGDRGLALVIPERECGVVDFDLAPGGGQVFQPESDVALAEPGRGKPKSN